MHLALRANEPDAGWNRDLERYGIAAQPA